LAIHVSPDKVRATASEVIISDPNFATELARNPAYAYAVLLSAGKFDLDQVSIDASGSVRIANPEYAKALGSKISTLSVDSALDNGACGAGC
jgi:hypothetical protein